MGFLPLDSLLCLVWDLAPGQQGCHKACPEAELGQALFI